MALFPFSFMQSQSPYDPDAAAFFARVAAAGGTLSNTEKTATNQLVLDMKAYGIWTSMKAVYPMVGASAAACAQNLVSASFTGTFSSGWTFASTGVTPNGTSAYMNSGLQMQQLSNTTNHLSAYMRGSVANDKSILGVSDGGSRYTILGTASTDTYYNAYCNIFLTTATITRTGYLLGISISGNEKLFRNGTQVASKTPTTTASTSTQPFYLGCYNNNGSPLQYIDKEIAFSSLGDGLTDTQASNFYTAVQTFNQTLNRQVGAQIVSDADAQAYINRVYTAGGTLTNTEANAVNQLVIDMKAAGIWTAMKAVYPMVGSSAAACAQNLKSSSFTGTFTSGWTFSSTGATANGTSAYFNTQLNPNTQLTIDNLHLSYYSRTQIGNTINQPMRVTDGINDLQLSPNINFASFSFRATAGGSSAATAVNTDCRGFFVGSRTANNLIKGYKSNSILATDTTSGTNTLPNFNLYLGAANNAGSAANYSLLENAFASIGDGLNDTQATSLYTCVQTFNTSLSRQV